MNIPQQVILWKNTENFLTLEFNFVLFSNFLSSLARQTQRFKKGSKK